MKRNINVIGRTATRSAGRPTHYHLKRYAGFPGLAGLPPAPPKKKTPSSGGKMFAARANTHPRNPPKPPLWSTGLIIAEASMAFT
jgi:hypothetical protein